MKRCRISDGRCIALGLCLMLVLSASQAAAPKIHRFTSNTAWNVNSWLLESEQGLVLIDAQMLAGDAARLAAFVKSFDKPLAGVIITHPHPDHFLGLSPLKEALGSFAIYSTEATADGLAPAVDTYMTWAPASYGDDVLSSYPAVTHRLRDTTELTLAGMTLQVVDFGPGEGAGHAVVYEPLGGALFSGDVTMHHSHYYVGEGRSAQVLAQFERLRNTFPKATMIYSGHGDPARPSIIDDHIEYVNFVRQLATTLLADPENIDAQSGALTGAASAAFSQGVKRKYGAWSDYGLPFDMLMGMNLAGLQRELGNKAP